jgi:hypothetical protein
MLNHRQIPGAVSVPIFRVDCQRFQSKSLFGARRIAEACLHGPDKVTVRF